MKKNNSICLTLLALLSLASCGQKTVTSYSSGSSSSSSSSTSTTTTTTTTTTTGCDGVYRSNASSCYYQNLPEIALSGPGTYGTTLWSSLTDLSSYGISQNQFATDATFSVRMIPSYISDARTSKQGRICSQYMSTNFTKMKLYVMLRKSGVTVGEVATLTATYSGGAWSYSNTYRYNVPGGTTSPYILEVVGVTTNHRCLAKSGSTTMSYYGSIPSTCSSNEYMDIPVVSATTTVPNPATSCIGFKLQMATDTTYDLPN